HRPRPRHQESGRRPDRYRLSDPGRRGSADHFRPARIRRALPRRLLRHQCRRRGAPGKGAWTRPYYRDHSRGLRYALSIEAFQSGFLAREKTAGAALARAALGNQGTLSLNRRARSRVSVIAMLRPEDSFAPSPASRWLVST